MTEREKLLLRAAAARLDNGMDPFGHDLLVQYGVPLDEFRTIQEHARRALLIYAGLTEDVRNMLIVAAAGTAPAVVIAKMLTGDAAIGGFTP